MNEFAIARKMLLGRCLQKWDDVLKFSFCMLIFFCFQSDLHSQDITPSVKCQANLLILTYFNGFPLWMSSLLTVLPFLFGFPPFSFFFLRGLMGLNVLSRHLCPRISCIAKPQTVVESSFAVIWDPFIEWCHKRLLKGIENRSEQLLTLAKQHLPWTDTTMLYTLPLVTKHVYGDGTYITQLLIHCCRDTESDIWVHILLAWPQNCTGNADWMQHPSAFQVNLCTYTWKFLRETEPWKCVNNKTPPKKKTCLLHCKILEKLYVWCDRDGLSKVHSISRHCF